MPRLILLGPPGSGKSTQAAEITRVYGTPATATGDILRENLEEGTALGLRAKGHMEAGELVPDDLMIALVEDRIVSGNKKNGFVLDGFPRTLAQAKAFDVFLSEKGCRIDKVFYFNVPKDVLMKRIEGRRVCPACGAAWHIELNPTKKEGICDRCGAALVHRSDDKPKTIENRLAVYDIQTKPLIDYFIEQGLLVELDGTLDARKLQDQIDKILDTV